MNQNNEVSLVLENNAMQPISDTTAAMEDSTKPSEGDPSPKRRRIPNSKYDDGIGSAEDEDYSSVSGLVAATMMRKNSEEFARPEKTPPEQPQVVNTGEEQVVKSSPKSSAKVPNKAPSRCPLTSRSRISAALSSEKISRILMRALQVLGPLSATQMCTIINKKRKPNVEEISLRTVTAILQLLAATPVINRIPRKAEDSEEVYVWHESCNVNRSQEESLREPLRVSTALAEVVRGKRAVEDARERIMLIKAELKAPEENSIRSLQNVLQSVLSSRRELFDPSLHPKHTDLIYRRACRVARLPVETRLNEATSMFDANELVAHFNQTEKQPYELEEQLPFPVSEYNINAHYDTGYNKSCSKSERRAHKRDKSDDLDAKLKKPVTPSAYSAWCREGMLVRHKSGRDGHIIRLKGPWIEVKFIGAKNSCATRVSDLQPIPTKQEDIFA